MSSYKIRVFYQQIIGFLKVWILKSDGFFNQNKKIKVLWLLNFCFYLDNLIYLFYLKRKKSKVIEKLNLNIIEVIKIFGYKKLNNRFWDRSKLYH